MIIYSEIIAKLQDATFPLSRLAHAVLGRMRSRVEQLNARTRTPVQCAGDHQRVVIRPFLREVVVVHFHSGRLSAHMCSDASDFVENAAASVLAGHGKTSVGRFVCDCRKCTIVKIKVYEAKVQQFPADSFGKLVHIDIPGPYLGNLYALSSVNRFTMWPEAAITMNMTAETTVEVSVDM